MMRDAGVVNRRGSELPGAAHPGEIPRSRLRERVSPGEKPVKSFRRIAALCMILGAVMALSLSAAADDILLPEESNRCLECHGKRGITKQFENRESVSAYVDVSQFKSSAHGFLACPACHPDFSEGRHPSRTFKNKLQYRTRACLACRRCHGEEEIKKKSIHVTVFREEEKGKPSLCTDCHGAHTIMPVRGGKKYATEKQFCLTCHTHEVHGEFRSGERLALQVDPSLLESSVHSMLSCSDCHYGFSSEDHPRRNFRTRRDYAITSSETCRRCHFDKYTKVLDSVHYLKLSEGNKNAPVCTDCHGAHAVLSVRKERTPLAQRCQKCHPDVYRIYAGSVHGNALVNEFNRDVPVCTDCHTSHSIANPHTADYREKIPELCSSCHANKEVMTKYGLSTDVVKTYLSDFHGITLSFYKKEKDSLQKPRRPIAVCTDCHGTHSIAKTKGMSAATMKANLGKQCQKCHAKADQDFPDAWLPHYQADVEKAPLVYVVNALYKVFLPIMLIGLVLQILVHIWRYAINR